MKRPGTPRRKGRPTLAEVEARCEMLDNGCLVWKGQVDRKGYGFFHRHLNGWPGKITKFYVHRIAYEDRTGTDLGRLEIHHTCETHNCVRQEHLEALTRQEHRNRHHPQDKCLHGHDWAENLEYDKRGSRRCRSCVRERARARSRRQRLERAVA